MITIISKGKLPGDKEYTVECLHCDISFKFNASDGMLTYDFRDGDFYNIACPLCSTDVFIKP